MNKKKQIISTIGICSICDKTFQDQFIVEEDSLSFCKEHFKIFKENIWVIKETVECSEGNEKASVELYKKKNQLFIDGILGYLKPSYKHTNDIIITTIDFYQIKKP